MQFRKGCKQFCLLLPALAMDRITKHAATLLAPDGVQTVIPGVLSWAYTQNRGAAFSIFSGRSGFLVLITVALIAGLLIYLMRHPKNPALERIGMWLIVGGGLGNLWDRLNYGFVVDFIRLDFVNFAVFNIADILVCAGALLIVWSVLATEVRKQKHG